MGKDAPTVEDQACFLEMTCMEIGFDHDYDVFDDGAGEMTLPGRT